MLSEVISLFVHVMHIIWTWFSVPMHNIRFMEGGKQLHSHQVVPVLLVVYMNMGIVH